MSMMKTFYGGGGILGGIVDVFTGGDDDVDINVPKVDTEADEDDRKKKMAQRRKREADLARGRTGRAKSLLTGSGSTASAPTQKASLLGHTAKN